MSAPKGSLQHGFFHSAQNDFIWINMYVSLEFHLDGKGFLILKGLCVIRKKRKNETLKKERATLKHETRFTTRKAFLTKKGILNEEKDFELRKAE